MQTNKQTKNNEQRKQYSIANKKYKPTKEQHKLTNKQCKLTKQQYELTTKQKQQQKPTTTKKHQKRIYHRVFTCYTFS